MNLNCSSDPNEELNLVYSGLFLSSGQRTLNVLVIVFSLLAYLFGSTEAKADLSDRYCGSTWQGVVSRVQTEPTEGKAILFSGPDGRVYNCLNQPIPDHTIEGLELWLVPMAQMIATDPFYEVNTAPNFCNSSYEVARRLNIMIIHLPYDNSQIESPSCVVRLRNISNRVRKFTQRN